LQWADAHPACVRVLPNIFESQFVPGPKPQHLVERHGLQGRNVLLTVSRLAASERYKGHDRVISALPTILSRYPDIIYVIVGDGDDRSRIQELAKTSGVGHAVRLVGHVADRDLPDYFRMADAFVMPSTGEGFGIVYLEAAASGIPVIAGNGDGSADALADGVLGTLIDPADLNELGRAIVDALETPSRRARSGVERFAFPGFSRHAGEILGRIAHARISTPV
jgi:phosphatidylinositol alpha-1,6-mannosyltransferase